MKTIKGNIWDYDLFLDHICVTVNLVQYNGRAVMGAGIALEAKQRFPDIDLVLGEKIKQDPTKLGPFGLVALLATKRHSAHLSLGILSFPTKPGMVKISTQKEMDELVLPRYRKPVSSLMRKPMVYEGWKLYSSLELIERSLSDLKSLMDFSLGVSGSPCKVGLPFPGIGNGGLKRSSVQELLDKYFKDNDRLFVFTK